MFEEFSDDRADLNVLGKSRDPRLQTADAADNQADLHPCAGRLIQRGDDLLVTEGIHLRDDRCRLSVFCMLRLPVDQMQEFRSEPQRGNRKHVPV